MLRGSASYVGNLVVDGMLHLAFVRSDFAQAKVLGLDVDHASQMSGVVKVYNGETIGLGPIPQPLWSLNANCVRHDSRPIVCAVSARRSSPRRGEPLSVPQPR